MADVKCLGTIRSVQRHIYTRRNESKVGGKEVFWQKYIREESDSGDTNIETSRVLTSYSKFLET